MSAAQEYPEGWAPVEEPQERGRARDLETSTVEGAAGFERYHAPATVRGRFDPDERPVAEEF